MNLIKNVLLDKKYFEGLDDVEQMLIDNEVDMSSIVQSLIFDKEIFPEEDDARLWVREHGFNVEEVFESEGKWVVSQLDVSEFIETTLRTIPIGNGIEAIVGVLKIDGMENGSLERTLGFSLRNDESIKLNDQLPHIIELARVVEGHHVSYGKVSITKDMIKSFEHNFDEGVFGVDLMIDYDHETRGAAGWIKSVFSSFEGDVLFGEVKWTPKGAQALSDREFRYFSPEFTLNYTHPHTGESHGPTLMGGGLVNRPFLKMDAVVGFNEKQKQTNEVPMETILLNEHNAIKSGLEKQVSDLKLTEEKAKKVIDGQKSEIVKLSEENKEIKDAQAKAETEAKHDKLFSEGKISKAQLVALNEGKDLYDVLALSEKLNVNPTGKSGNENVIELSEADQKACDALGVSKEDYAKYNS